MGKGARVARRRNHLRLVEPNNSGQLPSILTDPRARKEFEQLTQQLLDAVIEIMDLADGDADLEANGDESEDSDGI
jgi:hypothetical protein